jgi:hypothetical protein
MGGLPDVLNIPDGPEKLSLPPKNLPISILISCLDKTQIFRDMLMTWVMIWMYWG